MPKFRKVKSLTKSSGYSKEISEKFGPKHLEKILDILKKSFRSEDFRDYATEDFSWGPALGAAANNAKEFNKELRVLIAVTKKEIEKIRSRKSQKRSNKYKENYDSFFDPHVG